LFTFSGLYARFVSDCNPPMLSTIGWNGVLQTNFRFGTVERSV